MNVLKEIEEFDSRQGNDVPEAPRSLTLLQNRVGQRTGHGTQTTESPTSVAKRATTRRRDKR